MPRKVDSGSLRSGANSKKGRSSKHKSQSQQEGDANCPSLLSASSSSGEEDSSSSEAEDSLSGDDQLTGPPVKPVKLDTDMEPGQETKPPTTEDLKIAGNNLFGTAKYSEALEKYEEALTSNEKNENMEEKEGMYIKLKNNIAQCHLQKKEYQLALNSSLDAIEAGSMFSKSFHRASKAFQMLGRSDLAYDALKVGLETSNIAEEKEQIRKEIKRLKQEKPEVRNVKDKKWRQVDLRKLAQGLARSNKQSQQDIYKMNDDEDVYSSESSGDEAGDGRGDAPDKTTVENASKKMKYAKISEKMDKEKQKMKQKNCRLPRRCRPH